jgi:iron complex outermembrane receptor protein
MTPVLSFAARSMRRAAALALLPAALAAQGGTGTLSGRVTSAGSPLASAIVSSVGRATQTKSDGSYRLVLPEGRHEVRVGLIGYRARRDSVTITAGSTLTRDYELEKSVATLDVVATIGSRGQARTVIDAPAPIDVLSAAEIKSTGRTETAQMIQAIAPSFNFPRTSIGDGTDAVRPATLRSLAPDQSLVLVNGKRRHNSALVNVNGFVGRGSAPVDLNAIPASMIDHIEILRDGAAAQYGSDAIAGVINIVLKGASPGEARVTLGQAMTTYNRPDNLTPFPLQVGEREARDGKVFHTALDQGWSFPQNGFLHLAGELRDRGYTNRTLLDPRIQYFPGDPRETDPTKPLDGRIDHRQGDAATHDVQGFWNGGTSFGATDFYSFGGASVRRSEAPGFFRRPNDDRTLRNIYPDGFLPMIHSDIKDLSGAVGLKGAMGGWNWDLGTVYGTDQFAFTIKNSANVSLGPTSPTQFDAGKLRFGQSTTTLDLNRDFKPNDVMMFPLNLAAGAEFRADRYEIVAGEYDSWRNGGARVIDQNGNVTTRPGAPGAQVFPGFKGDSGGKPNDAGTHSRSNTALYVDLSSDVTPRVLFDLAGRYEKYSDFGSTTTMKFATRVKATETVALRGAASTGFRAPSLMQEYFSSTATNFVGGVPFDIKTFPANSREAQALGANPLVAEKSNNYSLGIATEPIPALSLTFDYYYIEIDDRIVLSNNFTGAIAIAALSNIGVTGISGGRYFTNAIDTKTHGYDAIANYGLSFGNSSVLRLTAAYNHNRTRVTRVAALRDNVAGLQGSLFDRVEQARIEIGNPENNLILSGNYSMGGVGLMLRTQRYGQVTSYGSAPSNAFGPLDQIFSPKWVTDLSGSYNFNRVTLTVGADNIFDVYPDRNNNNGNFATLATENGGTSNFGIFPYAGITPFGFNGRFIYTRVALGL